MIAQATLDGFFGLFSMPEIFGFWRNLFVTSPVRPNLLVPAALIEAPPPDGWDAVVYPIKRGDDAERADEMRYALVRFKNNRQNFETATYFKAEGLAEVTIEHDLPKMTSTDARRFDTKRPLEQEDKAWLVETLERQRVKRTRKRDLRL